MRHIVVIAAGLGALVVTVTITACPTESSSTLPRVICIVDDDADGGPAGATPALVVEQQLSIRIPPMAIELFLDGDSGGPLRCRPSAVDCPALDDCVGAPVQVPVGTQATLAVGVRPVPGEALVTTVFDATVFADSSDPAFSFLAPLPTSLTADDEAVFFLVSVTPATEGPISAQVILGTDARNAPSGTRQVSITLQVEGVQP
jgi:hypothetical protein